MDHQSWCLRVVRGRLEYECLVFFRGEGVGCWGKGGLRVAVWVSARCWVLRKRLVCPGSSGRRGVGWFSWCCLGGLSVCAGGLLGVGVLFENCIVDASIFVALKIFLVFV